MVRPSQSLYSMWSRWPRRKEQKGKRPESARQVETHLDSTLTIQTRRRFVSTAPSKTEELRTKYKVMSNMWLLAQMREPGRKLHEDFDKDTFMDFADKLVSEKNFRCKGCNPAVGPLHELRTRTRNEAITLAMEKGYRIKSAL